MQVPSSKANGMELTLFSSYEIGITREQFLVTAPMYGGELYPLHKDEVVTVAYVTEKAFFQIDAVVLERLRKGDLQFIRLQCISGVKRNQRRNDFRVDVLIETTLYPCLQDDPKKIDQTAAPMRGLINNLSGGGAALYINGDTEAGNYVALTLPPEVLGKETLMTAQVHWVREPDTKVVYKHYIGAHFIYEVAGEKETLIRYTFEQQRKQIQNT